MKFHLSGLLMRYSDYQKDIPVEAATFGEAVKSLVAKFPDLRPVLLDNQGLVREVHRIFLNGDVVRRDEVDRKLTDADAIDIMTALAGG